MRPRPWVRSAGVACFSGMVEQELGEIERQLVRMRLERVEVKD